MVDKLLAEGPDAEEDDGLRIDRTQLAALERPQKRDLLLLAAIYDQPRMGTYGARWNRLRRATRFTNFSTWNEIWIGLLATIIAFLLGYLLISTQATRVTTAIWIAAGLLLAGWGAYLFRLARQLWRARQVTRNVRVGRRDLGSLSQILMRIPGSEIAASRSLPLDVVMTAMRCSTNSNFSFAPSASVVSSYWSTAWTNPIW